MKMRRDIRNIVRHDEVSEKSIERYLVGKVREMGGECLKFSSMIQTGFPDRVVLLPGGGTVWVELKSRGRKPTPLQEQRLRWLRENGHRAYVADSRESVNGILGL